MASEVYEGSEFEIELDYVKLNSLVKLGFGETKWDMRCNLSSVDDKPKNCCRSQIKAGGRKPYSLIEWKHVGRCSFGCRTEQRQTGTV